MATGRVDGGLGVNAWLAPPSHLLTPVGDATFVAADNIVTGQPITMGGFTFQAGRNGVVPGANEMAVPSFDVTSIGNLEPAPYVGAVQDANDDWYLGWTVDQDGNLTTK